MELTSVINNDGISNKMKDIYKFIEKHGNDIDDILNKAYQDIKNLYPGVSMTGGVIEVSGIDTDSIVSVRNECHTILSYHAKQVLADNSYLSAYAFKINMMKTKITIAKKR